MRVLMLTDRFPPEVRSAAHLFHDLARELQRRGHQVAVITRAPTRYLVQGETRNPPLGWEEVGGVSALRVRGLPLAGHHPLIRGLEHLALGSSFGRAARQWPEADVVLVYSPPLPLAAAGAAYYRRFGAAFVLNVQDLYPQTPIDLGLLRNRIAIALSERMERRAYRKAARIVVHSAGNRAFLLERKRVPREKVHVIYNWVDLEALHPAPRENGFRAEQGLEGKFVVSYAGLMGYAQDLGTVIEGATLLQADPDVVFLLVGEGVLESRWRKMVAERSLGSVRFLPMQSRHRYAQLLTASDVCLIPLDGALRTPVVPGKLQSIMACGRPIVAIMDLGGDTPKLLAESAGGVSVPPGRPASLADAIRRLKADPVAGEEMGRRGRAFAEANFSIARCADAYESLFAEILRERGRKRARA